VGQRLQPGCCANHDWRAGGNTHANTNCYSNCHTDSYTNSDSNDYTNADAIGHTYWHSDYYSDSNAFSYTKTYFDAQRYSTISGSPNSASAPKFAAVRDHDQPSEWSGSAGV